MSAITGLPSTNELLLLDDGIEVQHSRSYGVGTDVHSKFIAVCVIVKVGDTYREYKHDFPTDWHSLLKAKEWIVQTIFNHSNPPITDLDSIHYVLESTSTYHIPVVKAFGGEPSIINPSIAGATKRKTDKLDAKRLALHDLMGVWRATFVPNTDVIELRLVNTYRKYHMQMATKISNRINTNINRFGYTVGREGSVTRSKTVRGVIEKLLAGEPISPEDNLCPDGIPEQIRGAIIEGYSEYETFRASSKRYEKMMIDKAKSMSWETRTGTISGDQLIKILMTAPGIGEITAVLWLAQIVTPCRFPNAKAIGSYCGLDPSIQISAGKVTSRVKRSGCRNIHTALTMAASVLVKNHDEMFGQWGYRLYKQSGRWKKATNAVARKLAVSLFHMHMKAEPFSYDKYKLVTEEDVIDVKLEAFSAVVPEFKRYMRVLIPTGVETTRELVKRYYNCTLRDVRGLGKKFYSILKDFIDNQKRYRELFSA
ncbi:hypothetical protein FACS1894184_13160 [Clostridia bacterium]|nr:hypothetical protein FACS1894184_13160 [Clostridia bacterium]